MLHEAPRTGECKSPEKAAPVMPGRALRWSAPVGETSTSDDTASGHTSAARTAKAAESVCATTPAGARTTSRRKSEASGYAVDLLGFGYSDKPANAPYSAELYVEMLADFLREAVGRPAHVVAHSLSAAFAVRVADEHPELVESLVLVSPTGADNMNARPGMSGAAFYGLLHSPVLGESFYNAMTSERSIRDFARTRLFYEKRFVTPRLVAHHYAVSHLPGAQYAVTAFISGYLNTDIREPFARLRHPLTLVWGKQDTANPVEQAGLLLRLNPRARLEIFDRCRLMPQEEHAERFNSLLREALRSRPPAPRPALEQPRPDI